MTLKRREYHVDCRVKKAAIFFVACEQNPATRVKIPNAMRIMSSEGVALRYWVCPCTRRELEDKLSYFMLVSLS